MKIAFIYPGQGAQYPKMGYDLYKHFSSFRDYVQQAGDLLKVNFERLLFESTQKQLNQTHNCQIALYVVSIACSKVISEQFSSINPHACAGLSLGEYSACVQSAYLNFEDGLQLVSQRGRLMEQACNHYPGTMCVVVGLDTQVVVEMVRSLDLPDDLWVANQNCPSQVVLSGTHKGIERAMLAAKEIGAKRVLPLEVHGAFHSGLMDEVSDGLKQAVQGTHFLSSQVPLVMNVDGMTTTNLDQIRKNLIQQVNSPVLWENCVSTLTSMGIDLFLEIGCGNVLAGLNRRMKVKAPTLSIYKLDDFKVLYEKLEALGV